MPKKAIYFTMPKKHVHQTSKKIVLLHCCESVILCAFDAQNRVQFAWAKYEAPKHPLHYNVRLGRAREEQQIPCMAPGGPHLTMRLPQHLGQQYNSALGLSDSLGGSDLGFGVTCCRPCPPSRLTHLGYGWDVRVPDRPPFHPGSRSLAAAGACASQTTLPPSPTQAGWLQLGRACPSSPSPLPGSRSLAIAGACASLPTLPYVRACAAWLRARPCPPPPLSRLAHLG